MNFIIQLEYKASCKKCYIKIFKIPSNSLIQNNEIRNKNQLILINTYPQNAYEESIKNPTENPS